MTGSGGDGGSGVARRYRALVTILKSGIPPITPFSDKWLPKAVRTVLKEKESRIKAQGGYRGSI